MGRAFVFPGQGAQVIGMGADLAEEWPEAKAVFDEVDDALGEPLSELIWQGDIADLTLTQNAQPALMATSMAVMAALNAEGVDVSQADFVAGHSLGEYSALCAAGAFSVGDAAKLLRTRGSAMQEAVPVGEGAMAAILGLNLESVRAIVADAAKGEVLAAANDNDPGQVVISGHKDAVERAATAAKEAGAKRAMLLPVSAPFHCDLMEPAARVMAQALAQVEIAEPRVPLVANVLAEPVQSTSVILSLLVDQIVGSVRWRESVEHMAEKGVNEYFEIGAGKALSGMIRRIDRESTSHAVGTVDGVRAAVAAISG
jgi:[acyl-carrier-protein] S-malonyltransferase